MTRFFNRSILNSSLRHHALLVGMLYLAHFGDGIRKFNNCRMSVAPRQDHMHHFWLLLQPLGHLGRIEHPLPDCPQRRAHRSRGLSFARPGVHDDESAANVVHSTRILDCNRWPCLARYRRTAITARPNRVGLQAKWLQCAPDLEKRCSQSARLAKCHTVARISTDVYILPASRRTP